MVRKWFRARKKKGREREWKEFRGSLEDEIRQSQEPNKTKLQEILDHKDTESVYRALLRSFVPKHINRDEARTLTREVVLSHIQTNRKTHVFNTEGGHEVEVTINTKGGILTRIVSR